MSRLSLWRAVTLFVLFAAVFESSLASISEADRKTVALKQSDGTEWSTEELIAMQLSYVKKLAEDLAGESVNEVILTVPPYKFEQFEQDSVADAIEIAGLKTLALVNDGTVVAVNYAMTRTFSTTPEYHVIYDAGASSNYRRFVCCGRGSQDDVTIHANQCSGCTSVTPKKGPLRLIVLYTCINLRAHLGHILIPSFVGFPSDIAGVRGPSTKIFVPYLGALTTSLACHPLGYGINVDTLHKFINARFLVQWLLLDSVILSDASGMERLRLSTAIPTRSNTSLSGMRVTRACCGSLLHNPSVLRKYPISVAPSINLRTTQPYASILSIIPSHCWDNITVYKEAVDLRPVGHPERAVTLELLADALSSLCERRGNDGDHDEAIALARESLNLWQVGNPGRSASLDSLADAFSTHFERQKNDRDLDEAIVLYREAHDLLPVSHPDRWASLNNLAGELLSRFQHRGNDQDLDEAVALYREALVLLSDGHQDRCTLLTNLGVGHPDRCDVLTRLGDALSTCFTKLGNDDLLEEAIALRKEALDLQPVGHPDRYKLLTKLGDALSTCFTNRISKLLNLATAFLIFTTVTSVATARPGSSRLGPRGLAFAGFCSMTCSAGEEASMTHHKAKPNRAAATLTVTKRTEATDPQCHSGTAPQNSTVHMTADSWHQPHTLPQTSYILELPPTYHLLRPLAASKTFTAPSRTLTAPFRTLAPLQHLLAPSPTSAAPSRTLSHLCNTSDHLTFAAPLRHLLAAEEILVSTISFSLVYIMCIEGATWGLSCGTVALSSAVQLCTEQSSLLMRGNDELLEEAIALHREALDLQPVSHPDWSRSLNDIANALVARFCHQGNDKDLDDATTIWGEELYSLPAGHHDRSVSLDNLATALITRFTHRGNDKDIDDAIALHRERLDLGPDSDQDLSASLINLARALDTQFKHQGNVELLDEAIALSREALNLQSVGHRHRIASSNNLAAMLESRFKHSDNHQDLDEAVALCKSALDLRSDGHMDRLELLVNLADVLSVQFTHQGNIRHLDEALENACSALSLLRTYDPRRSTVHRLLATIHMLFYESRLHSTGEDVDSLNAAMGDLRAGVDSIPSGLRSRLQTSLLWIRSAEKYTHSTLPEAYATAIQLVDAYISATDSMSSRHHMMKDFQPTLAVDAASCALRHDDVCRAVELLEQGRTLIWTQMARFRMPIEGLQERGDHADGLVKKFRELELPEGSTRVRVDAEAVRYTGLMDELKKTVEEIRKLEGFSRFMLPPLFSDFKMPHVMGLSLFSSQAKTLQCWVNTLQRMVRREAGPEEAQTKLIEILRELWDDVVCPVVEHLGRFARPGSRIWARERHDRSQPMPFAAIGQDHPPGYPFSSPSVEPELELVRDLLPPAPTISFTKITSVKSTKSRALNNLRDNHWLHFACHGTQNLGKPFKSAFLMRDEPLTLLDITQTDLSRHEFAFLSACETAVGDFTTPDEVIHLAAALQFAGVKSVIGTFWSVNDSTVQRLVEAFYRNLCGDGKMNPKRAARALHMAVQSLANDKDIALDQRIVFMHVGI
ncbi:hypothetical protein M405DRAFT_885320 [Rhizopogon salebrosus TDB-379]|nr:hypothetical protein M405DRAFT_885320 [Rhizopogon salebrosus TDB-379]